MEKLSVKMVITASLLLNIGSFYLFSFYNSIVMLVITIVILSISNIFFLTNMQTYYVSLYQNADVSSMRALSIYSAVENFSMAIGPVVFSYILARNMDMNMKLFASCLLACLIVFILISMFFKTKKNK
jgi:predicted MFS family arabinose efflux permease